MKATKTSKKLDETVQPKMSNQNDCDKALPTPILDTFYPNECFICKSPKDLRRCRRCQMISYCGEAHQKDHSESHKEICKIIADILKRKKVTHLFENLRGIDQSGWKVEREIARMEVQTKLSRPILRNELQMILYPRACFVCHEAKQQNLVNCPSCPSASFCSQHKNANSHNCFHLKFCHDLDIGLDETNLAKAVGAAHAVVDRTFFTSDNQSLPKSLKQLITHYPKPPVEAPENIKIYSSELLTDPLTLFNALQKLQLSTLAKLVVHLSGFETVYDNPIFWEILLHLLPHLKFLKIVIVNDRQSVKKESKLCSNCRWQKKHLEIETVTFSYGEYLKDAAFQKPDIVVCYNAEPSEANQIYEELWKCSLSAWGSVSCPLVFTTRTDSTLKEMTDILKSSFPNSKFYYEALNEFASLRPTREWELGGIYKDNQFMLVLKVPHGDENEKTPDLVNGVKAESYSMMINHPEPRPKKVEKIVNSDKNKIATSLESVSATIEKNSASLRNGELEKIEDLVNGDVPKNCDSMTNKFEDKASPDEVQKSDFLDNEVEKRLEADKDQEESLSFNDKIKASHPDESVNEWDFFYINSCQVCHINHRVVPCTRCKMISYCGDKHRKEHWPKHKDLCKVILGMLKETEATNLFDKLKTSDTEAWMRIKIDMMLRAQSKLGRQLVDFERQMFLFPKTCFDCHESDLSILKTCDCGISLCKQHKKNLNHQNLCDNLKLAFENCQLLQNNKSKSLPAIADQGSTMISIRSVPIQTKLKNLPSTIKDFMDSCITSSDKVAELFSKNRDIFSEVLSRPLTLLYGIQKLNLTSASSLTIHVIGATNEEFRCVGYWEILLHWLPKLKEIKVAFVGPEINGPFQLAITACESCNFVSKKPALVSSRRSRYDEYFASKFYSKPDIIVGYNLDLHESELGLSESTWKETILTLKMVEAPFILTAGTEDRARKDHATFCHLFEKSVSHNCCEINPFASLIPERDFATEELKYANKYIVIYEGLYVEKHPVGSGVSELKGDSVADESEEGENESLELEVSKKQLEDVKVNEEEKEIGASGLAALEEKLAAAEIAERKSSDEVFQVPVKEEKAEVPVEEKPDAQEVKDNKKETLIMESEETEKNKEQSENVESVAKSESKPNLSISENQEPLRQSENIESVAKSESRPNFTVPENPRPLHQSENIASVAKSESKPNLSISANQEPLRQSENIESVAKSESKPNLSIPENQGPLRQFENIESVSKSESRANFTVPENPRPLHQSENIESVSKPESRANFTVPENPRPLRQSENIESVPKCESRAYFTVPEIRRPLRQSENVESVSKSESRLNLRFPENHRPRHEDLLQENLMLRKENQLLRENQQLKEENSELKDENQKLKQENERLRIENDVIKDLRSQVEESIRAAMSGIHGCIK
ncbi:uncharacterized protein LOC117172900 isoform X2 [Belonocnema kinseyi]|uniref:uncharacterized protein LOC117172900 isoform X2 n=1 Tax=Belonocnema kinseyi TaxID=2817044 RepID=UPI00143DAEAE|nr:uncharacterized protein LOC117172900 isoform X2 [Belonocnema kinseyi]